MLEIIPRTTLALREPSAALTPFANHQLTHIVTHWPGDDRALAGLDTPELIRAWQRYHMDARKWRDLGYNYVVDQAGTVYEGRGWHVGGHVLGAQNARSVGIVFAVGNTEPLSAAAQLAGHQLRAWIEDRAGRQLTPIGHRDWANKACPGPSVYPWTLRGMPAPAPGAAPLAATTPLTPSKVGEYRLAPSFPLGRCRRHNRQMWYGPKSNLDHQVSGWANRQSDGTKGADGLHRWQERMAYRGWRITPDGLYGDETDRVATAFQSEKGLAADGLVGPDTWAAAWTAAIS